MARWNSAAKIVQLESTFVCSEGVIDGSSSRDAVSTQVLKQQLSHFFLRARWCRDLASRCHDFRIEIKTQHNIGGAAPMLNGFAWRTLGHFCC